MADGTRGYAHRVDIVADIEQVWRALTEPTMLAQWYAPDARVDAREGGVYNAKHGELEREAHIDVFLPPRRLRLIYMPLANLPDDGTVLVEDYLLDRDPNSARQLGVAAVTILRLMGSGIPEGPDWHPTYVALRRGWERALPRLKVLLEKQGATPDALASPAGSSTAPVGPKR
ncbi:MAG: SRPBCC domain-containing protein [Steroidobacteraceae bacterium]